MTESTAPAPLYVLGVQVENFMRLAAIDLQIDPSGLTLFAGRNAQGKSSAMQAIEATLAGAGAIPSQPIRVGEDYAETSVILGPDGKTPQFTVTRKYRESGTSSVEIKGADGVKVASPQKLLDSFFAAGTFNPVEFAFPPGEKTEEGRNRKRREMLLAVAPVPIDLAKHDAERKKLFDERTVVNRRVKDAEAVTTAAVEAMTAPDGPIEDESELVNAIAKIDAGEMLRSNARRRAAEIEAETKDIEAQIVKLQERVKLLAVEWERQAGLAGGSAVDRAPLKTKLDEVRARNEARRRAESDRARAEERAKSLQAARAEAERLKAAIEKMDADRAAALAAAKFPVKALTITSDGTVSIRLGSGQTIPVEQASTAQKIMLSFAIGASRNPRLRTALMREANDLDAESLATLAKMARDKGYQLIAERIVPDAAGVSIVFENGTAAPVVKP